MLKTKKCSRCKELKDVNDFGKNSDGKYARHSICKDCRKLENKIYRKNNPEKVTEKNRKYRKNNSEKLKEYQRKYYKTNAYKINEYNKKYYKNNSKRRKKDPKFRLNHNIRKAIWDSLKGSKKGWENLVGYTVQHLISHLEKQFKDDMSWENYGKWHIDHIKPISSFNFNSYDDLEFKECWSLDNLQPLWAEENLRKSNKIIYES